MRYHKWELESDRNYFWNCSACGTKFYSMMKPENDWLATEHFKGTKMSHFMRAKNGDEAVLPEFQDCDFMAVRNLYKE